jgi:hypothetical protein
LKNSGHFAFYEDKQKFADELVQRLLPTASVRQQLSRHIPVLDRQIGLFYRAEWVFANGMFSYSRWPPLESGCSRVADDSGE